MSWSDVLRKRSPVFHLALAFAALSIIFSALGTIYLYHTWFTVKNEKFNALRSLAELTAASSHVFLHQYQSSLPVVAHDIADVNGYVDTTAGTARLQRFKLANQDIAAIYLFSPQGDLLAASTRETPDASNWRHMKDPVFRADFERALRQDAIVVGRTRFGKLVGDWIIPIRVRGKDAQGKVSFVLSAVVTMRQQEGLWRGISLPPRTVVGLLRDDGYLQARYPPPPNPEQAFLTQHNTSVFEPPLRDGEGLITRLENVARFADQGEVLLVATRIPEFSLIAYAHMATGEVWRAWFQRIRVTAVLFVLSLAALASTALWTIRQQRAREMERGTAHQSLRASEAALKRQTQLLEQSQRAANIGGWELDIGSGELYWTDETYRIHEVSAREYSPAPNTVANFYAPQSAQLMSWTLERAKRTGEPWDHELEVITYKGNRVWLRSTGKAELDATGKVVKLWGSYQDITQRRATEEQIRYLAHYDSLTGLANRNLFSTHLAHAIDRAKRLNAQVAVLFIDLDRFKHINDAVGHAIGDRVLKMLAQRLSTAVRSSDVLARLGGDEFIVAMEDYSGRADIEILANRILAAVDQPIVIDEDEFAITASIGISTYPNEGADVPTLVKNADVAMYRAKEAGKNRYAFYSEQMSLASAQRLALEAQLRKAVQDTAQLLLHYQPRLHLREQRICGVEALVRWQHPERGLIAPSQFVPMAEDSGLIHALGAWVLRTACVQAAQWQRQTKSALCIAVNLSARELYRTHLVNDIRTVLTETLLPAPCLELEITETAMLHNLEQVAEVLAQLKDLGVRIAVDDFGTGYSSLAHLRRLPLDCVKIDRSFVSHIPEVQDDVAITRAVIAMAHSLRLAVVAEGVETPAQLRFLTELGCDEVQGHLISRPLEATTLLALLQPAPLAASHASVA